MQTPREILADLWSLAGGDSVALDDVTLTGDEPQLPSSFRVGASAQVGLAAAGLAAAQIWKMRSGQSQEVAVDMRHAVIECRSERYLRVDGKPPGPTWDAIAGIYKTRNARFVRLHTNFPHHRAAVCKVLNCAAEREQVQAALMQWDAEAFETAAYDAGGGVAMGLIYSLGYMVETTEHRLVKAGYPVGTGERKVLGGSQVRVENAGDALPPRLRQHGCGARYPSDVA